MTLAENAASYQTALATFADVTYSPSQMVKMFDAAIVESVNLRSDIANYSIAGKSISTDRATLQRLREYYDGLAKLESTDGAGMEITLVEF